MGMLSADLTPVLNVPLASAMMLFGTVISFSTRQVSENCKLGRACNSKEIVLQSTSPSQLR